MLVCILHGKSLEVKDNFDIGRKTSERLKLRYALEDYVTDDKADVSQLGSCLLPMSCMNDL